jgi:hypothetical protein
MATKHTCNVGRGPSFGRRTAGCPRCDELEQGAPPVVWARQSSRDTQRCADIRSHFQSARHLSGACGLVCTFGDW